MLIFLYMGSTLNFRFFVALKAVFSVNQKIQEKRNFIAHGV